MAVALLTTLYGAFLANVVCLPIAVKLGNRAVEEALNQKLVLDGIVGIADGQNPRVIEGILKNYIAASKRGTGAEEE
jgi:chemotaxis protein MotA